VTSVTGRGKNKVTTEDKFINLEKRLKELGRVAVTLSGGMDSSFLAYMASRILHSHAFAVTVWSPLLSAKDRNDIFSFADNYNIQLIRIQFDETYSDEFCANTAERCYVCKSMRLKMIEEYAREWHIPWIIDGTNADDLMDNRPGMKALKESDLTVSPLLECGFTKEDIRKMSLRFGLPTAEKPASACLASRIPTGTRVCKELLSTIDIGEDMLRTVLPENVQLRLRCDGNAAKIETEMDFVPRLSEKFDLINKKLTALGIKNVQIAKEGYHLGGHVTV
jgi:uncharacterized protein